VFCTDFLVDVALVHQPVAKKGTPGGMALAQKFLGETHAPLSALGSRELQKLPSREVPGTCGHDGEKASFIFGAADLDKVGETGFDKVHSLKIIVLNSSSSRMRRMLSVSPRRA
jgi:hypothetical protein